MTKDSKSETIHFKIFHQNIASVLPKLELLELTLRELREQENEPDVICLSETFLKAGYENYLKLYNYTLAASFCRDKQRGGTCILLKNNIPYKELIIVKKHSIAKIFECCGIEVLAHKLIIISVYRIPSSDPTHFLRKLDDLLHILTKIINMKIKIVIAGDFNINTLKNGKVATQFQDLCWNHNLKIHINTPTRKASCIDHILSNIGDATASVLPLHLSDHDTAQLLVFQVAERTYAPLRYFIYKRDYNTDNIRKFCDSMKNLSWSDIYTESNLNKAFYKFHELFCLFYRLCFPIVKIKVNNISRNKQRWISRGLKISCKTKRTLRFKCYLQNTATNKFNYKTYSKVLQKCINR